MLDKYNGDSDDKPPKNCMSILRLFFCGVYFPRCDPISH